MRSRRSRDRPRASGRMYMRFSSARVPSKRTIPRTPLARRRRCRRGNAGGSNCVASARRPTSIRRLRRRAPASPPRAALARRTSPWRRNRWSGPDVSNLEPGPERIDLISRIEGPERIELLVKWDRGHFGPLAVADADDERLVDVEVDPVPVPVGRWDVELLLGEWHEAGEWRRLVQVVWCRNSTTLGGRATCCH